MTNAALHSSNVPNLVSLGSRLFCVSGVNLTFKLVISEDPMSPAEFNLTFSTGM